MALVTRADLAQNFGRIVQQLLSEGFGTTHIAKHMGYTSTSQLNNSLENKSILSTKAILTLLQKFRVNPIYLFFGKGNMFMSDEDASEIEKLSNAYNELNKKYNESLEKIVKLKERNVALEKMTRNLLADTAEFMKSVTKSENKTEDKEAEESNQDIK